MEYIQIRGIEKDGLKSKLVEDFGIPYRAIEDEFLQFMEEFVNTRNSDEYITSNIEIPSLNSDTSSLPSGTISLLIPRIYYNIKKTTWILIGMLLDVFVTKGVASGSLSALGIAGQAIGKLNVKNGEVCTYYQAIKLKKQGTKEFEVRNRYNQIKGRNCPYLEFECVYNQNGKCNIKLSNLKENFQKLKEIGAFSISSNNKWRLEL
ncbi:hypothetical protein [Thermococcus sibiricus]|uniref:Uncharacterized protein n=1 Tax=Thermococcus sibiricus TaxID=172049 RepID=A0A101EKG7_9EURY|nr:hypothetical protein [Thermococcus sibiricus]KUK17028.1 MAG: hypothetical protein XD54_1670 [Thermococcus sibiricus]